MRVTVILLALSLLLAGCGNPLSGGTPTTQQTTAATTPETTVPETTVPETTVPETTEPANTLPYLVTVSRADFPYYQGPSYHDPQAGYVSAPGVYTVVEEARDASGNLWGKLKSGAGWLDLTRLEKEELRGPMVSMSSLAELSSAGSDYIYCPIASDQYAVKLFFKANVPLTNVEFFPFLLEETLVAQPPVYTVSSWDAGAFLLLEASFPGDLSAYGFRVTDSDGVTYHYMIGQNLSGEGDPFTLTSYSP